MTTQRKFNVPSSDGIHTLAGVIYLPAGEMKGFFHIVHGMTEHIGRYGRLMADMAEAGYLCFGYNNLGHGYTARDSDELGYIAKKDGHDLLAKDVAVFSSAVLAEYGNAEHRLPYYLMGHSMGSFITRLAVANYVKPDRYIIMGTGGKNPAAGAGLALIWLLKCLRGERHISPLVQKLAFGSYNDRFGGGSPEDPSPWLTRDAAVRADYYRDPFCNYRFTVSAMGDLIRLNKLTNEAGWYESVPKTMPILLISGAEDPVGDYGRGVRQVEEGLKARGCRARSVLYPDARHEILNDSTYEEAKGDILAFLREEA